MDNLEIALVLLFVIVALCGALVLSLSSPTVMALGGAIL